MNREWDGREDAHEWDDPVITLVRRLPVAPVDPQVAAAIRARSHAALATRMVRRERAARTRRAWAVDGALYALCGLYLVFAAVQAIR